MRWKMNGCAMTRVEDALRRQRRAKERVFGSHALAQPLSERELRQLIGRDEHRAIADEMARFV